MAEWGIVGSFAAEAVRRERATYGPLVEQAMLDVRDAILRSGRLFTKEAARAATRFELGSVATKALQDLARITVQESYRTHLLNDLDRLTLRMVRFNPDANLIVHTIRRDAAFIGVLVTAGALLLVGLVTDVYLQKTTGRGLLERLFGK